MIRSVFGGFSFGNGSPIHEERWYLSFMSWLFSVLLESVPELVECLEDILMFAPVWFAVTTTGAG